MKSTNSLLAIAILCFCLVPPAAAQTAYWDGGSGNWSSTNGWSASPPLTNGYIYVAPPNGGASAVVTTSNSTVAVNGSYTVSNLTVGSTDKITIGDYDSLGVSGTISNAGSIVVTSLTNPASLQINGAVTASGGGTITLNGGVLAAGSSSTFTNVDNTIQGGISASSPSLYQAPFSTFTNDALGTINANSAGKILVVAASSLQNSGTLEASNFGTLQLSSPYTSTSLNSTGGVIEANGGSTVQLGQSFISNTVVAAQDGGTVALNQYASITSGSYLGTVGSGKIVAEATSTVTLSGITNAGNYVGSNGSTTSISGAIVNSGTMTFNSTGNTTSLGVSGTTTLSGGGTITLNNGSSLGGAQYSYTGGNNPNSLTNVDNTIQGGSIPTSNSFGPAYTISTLTNETSGTINANVAGETLFLGANSVQNTGTLEASNGGTLQLGTQYSAAQLNSSGGFIEAQDGSTVYLGQNTLISNTTLTTTGSGKIATQTFTSPTAVQVYLSSYGQSGSGTLTNAGTYVGNDDSTTSLSGNIVNSGKMTFNSTGDSTSLVVSGTTTLSGGGTVTLNNGAYLAGSQYSYTGGNNPNSLTNVDNTIQGGSIPNPSSPGPAYAIGTLTNQSSGTINANVAGETLALNASTVQNTGTLEASNGGTLQLGSQYNPASLQSMGGVIEAQQNSTVYTGQYSNISGTSIVAQDGGTVFLANAIVSNSTLTTTGSGKIATQTFTSPTAVQVYLSSYGQSGSGTLTNAGTYVGNDDSTTSLSGNIVNSGKMTFNSTGDSTSLVVSGTTTLSGGGTVTLNNGAYLAGSQYSYTGGNNPNSLTNVDNTIQGGSIPNPSSPGPAYAIGTLTNQSSGTINANVAGETLALNASTVQNTGTLEASNGGTLQLGSQYNPASLQSMGGVIEAQQNSTVYTGQYSNISGTSIVAQDGGTVFLANAIVSNSTLTTTGSGKIATQTFTSPTAVQVYLSSYGQSGSGTLTNAGTYVGNDDSTTSLSGNIVNSGKMTFNSTGDSTSLVVSGTTTLSGGGTVTLNNGAALVGASYTTYPNSNYLDNIDNTIQGGSVVTNNTFPNPGPSLGNFVNETRGTFNANVAGETLAVNANSVVNRGTLEATNYGTLNVTGNIDNQASGTIYASAGAQVIANQGVSTNEGIINVTGGTFDNGGNAIYNSGTIIGYGTVKTGGITNNGTITLTGGASTVSGNVTNSAGQTLSVLQDNAVFTGNVVNNGTFRSTNSAATFQGTFTNNGAFITDPSTLNFTNLNITSSGYIQAGTGDVFNISGDVTNDSTSTQTNIASATLNFTGTGSHTLAWSSPLALNLNTLEVAANGTLTLNLAAGTSVYVTNLDLLGGASQLPDITIVGGGTVYYDPNAAGNSYLNDATYTLSGGQLTAGLAPEAVPEPSTWGLVVGGLGLLAFLQRRRAARRI